MARGTVTMVLAASLALLLLASSSASAARAGPVAEAAPGAVSPRHHQEAAAAGEGSCEGANDEDECMMARRTLAAHTDYIYTQEHHN